LLYGIGAHGIMTLNDFKALEGDAKMGVQSLPVTLGPNKAALVACWIMAMPQVVVVTLLFAWDRPVHAACVAGVLIAQLVLMKTLLKDPLKNTPWYQGTGISLYVSGMMIAAFAIRGMV